MIIKASEINVGDVIKDPTHQNDLLITRIETFIDEKHILFVGDNLAYGDSFWMKVNYDDTFEVERK